MTDQEEPNFKTLRTAKRPSSVEILASDIREAIVGGRLRPGQHLAEVELAETHGVGRSTVREALRLLIADGLVVAEQHRGAWVRRMTREDFLELYQVRSAIEGQAARLAAINVARGASLADLSAIHKEIEEALARRPFPGCMDQNTRFHRAIVDLAGNRLLTSVISSLKLQAFRIQSQTLMERRNARTSHAGHAKIFAAIAEGHPERAERAMRRHLEQGLEITLAEIPSDNFRLTD